MSSTESVEHDAYNGWTFPIALGLAVAFAVVQAVLFFVTGFAVHALSDAIGYRGKLEDASWILLGGIFVWSHALFVLLVIDAARVKPRSDRSLATAVVASIPLALSFFAFAMLDASGAAYGCAEGRDFRHTEIPMLPWLWIGWLSLTFFAIPTRLLGWFRKTSVSIRPIWFRLLLLPIGAVPVWLFGYIFQQRTVDCSVPQEMWGMFEGGVVALPLMGAFLFAMATSMAMLSAAFAVPKSPSA